MDVKQKKVDEMNLTLTVTLEKTDWEEPRKKKLNEFRRRADLKGFRKGMAPMSLIERIHGGQALAEVVNAQINEALTGYIEKHKLHIIGEPLPSEVEDKNDWDNPGTFKFHFDVALAPEVEVNVGPGDKIPYYNINATAKALKDYKENLLKQYGTLQTGKSAKADDFIVADFESGDQKVEKAYVALRSIQDEEVKGTLIGRKAGDTLEISILKAFPNEADRAAMFHVKKEELDTLPETWTMKVGEVKTFVNAKICQETFDNIFGKDNVHSEEEFDAKVKERLEEEYRQESEYRFSVDARQYLIDKAAITLPDAFLKRWIFTANDGKYTMEQIEAEYDLFAKDFRWDLIRDGIIAKQNLKVEHDDIMEEARRLAAYQFAMYGMSGVPQETIDGFAQNILKDEQQARRVVEKVRNDLALGYVRKNVTLDNKKVSPEKMRELTA